MKRANGTGSLRRRPNGTWEARFTDPSGKQRSIYGRTQKDVRQKLTDAIHEIDAGTWINPSTSTVGAWANEWLEVYCKTLAHNTRLSYESSLRIHILPALGELKLAKLTRTHCERWASGLTDKVSPASARKHIAVLKIMLGKAVDLELIRVNPASKVTVRGVSESRIKPMHIVDEEFLAPFLKAIQEPRRARYSVLFRTILMTGMRLGEAAGLRWKDIDMRKGTITIAVQLQGLSIGRYAEIPPKDGSSRVIIVPPALIALLKQHKADQAAARLRAGAFWDETGLNADRVFRSDDRGTPIGHNGVAYHLSRIGDQIGLPGLHPHDLRHSYAVAAIRSGVDIKTIQHNLGHKSATITLDVYSHYMPNAGAAAAEKIGNYFQLG